MAAVLGPVDGYAEMTMEFQVLGPLRVLDGSRSIELRAGKPRALLAALLCFANTPVSVDRLLTVLWRGEPPASAPENVRLYVYQLRRALGDAQWIVRQPPGYALHVRPEQLDAARFEELAQQGQNALRNGDPATATRALSEALALWRGPAYADLDRIDLFREESCRLHEHRQTVLEARIDADLALGRHHDLVPELSKLVIAQPLRERLRGQLMLALYRSGRQADALTAYQDARQVLAEELGLEPGPHLRELHQSILAGDPALDPPSVAVLNGGPADSPAPRQLPAHTPHFVGRQAELSRLAALLDAAHRGTVLISAINGTAGIGKTALALHWARQSTHRFPDGQLYVNLRGFDPSGSPLPPEEVICGMLDALGVPPERIPIDLDGKAALYRSLLADRKVLVLLDNARDIDQVRPLLPGSPGCLVVITSRDKLTGLITREGARMLTLDVLSTDDATELLASYLGHDRLAAERQAAHELIDRCARLPLALAIVAAQAAAAPAFPLRAFADELADEQRRLDALDAGDTTTSVRGVLSWSYHHVPAGAARMFRLLGLHPGADIAVPAAASLAGVPIHQARSALDELTRAHLLDHHAPGRFTFHDLLRAYANEQAHVVDPETDRQAALRRLFDHYLHTAHLADQLLDPHRDPVTPSGPAPGVLPERFADHEAAWAWCEAEHGVLLATITRAAATGFDRHAWQLCWMLGTFLERRGHWQEWEATAHLAVDAARRVGDRDGQGRSHLGQARACALLGSYQQALSHLHDAFDLYRELGDAVQQAHTRFALSWVLEHQSDLPAALEHVQQALEQYRATGNRLGKARSLNMVGWLHAQLGDHEHALACCYEALDLHVELADRLGTAHTWDSLGYAHHHLHNHAAAIDCYQQAVTLYRGLRNRYYQGGTLARLGDAHHAAGHTEAAHDHWRHALRLLDELRHPDAEQVRAKLTAELKASFTP
jgi:DNA-binding SARP family transcriptional activator